MPESRVKKTLLNARVNLIFYFLTLVLSFFSRKIFLSSLGTDFVGFTGALLNLLGFLNLAELGIGSAIGYLLYKPLFDHDETKINEIISVMGYLYRWIGIIIITAGCILACFLPLIFPVKDTGFPLSLVFFAYFSFLGSSLIGYFINYRQNLLGADQRNYVVTAYFQTANIIKTTIQMVLAYYTQNYYLWVAIEFIFSVIYSIILNWKINQTYLWLKADVKLGKKIFKKYPEVMVKTKQLFVHKISSFVQFQTTPFLIYAFVSLKEVALYGNYTVITDKVSQLISNFLGSTGAGVGNLIAEGDISKIKSIFWELIAIRYYVAGIVVFLIYMLMNPFIVLWLGHQYILDDSVLILILISLFISQTRGATDQFLFGYGLFQDMWAPIIEAVIYIVVAIIGGHLWGLPGVLLGSCVSQLVIICGWKPYFLFKCGFKLPQRGYWPNILKYISVAIVSITAMSYLLIHITKFINPFINYVNWVIYAIILTLSYSIIYLILMLIFTQGMRNAINRFFKIRSFYK